MTQPTFLAPSGPVGQQVEWFNVAGQQRAVLGTPGSAAIDALMLATDTNVRYVDPGGVDASSTTGSRVNPFRTVQAAINNCAALTSLANPFIIRVSPGTGFGTFKLAANLYIVGSGSGAGSYNGAPQSGVTYLAPNAAITLDSTWAGAAVKTGGIMNAALTTALNINFATIGSTAPSTLLFDDVESDSALTFVGSGNLEYATLRAVYINAASDLTFTDMGGSTLQGCANDFGGFVRYNQAAAIQGFHAQVGCAFGALVTNWTSAAIGNFMLVQMFTPFNGLNDGSSSITGAGSNVIAPGATFSVALSDAAHRLAFGNDAAATVVGVSCGRNIIRMTPTAARLLTIARPITNTGSTEIIVVNQSTTSPIDLSLLVSTIAAGSPTYVPPGCTARIIFDFAQAAGTILWTVEPITQYFQLVLTNGVSASTPADVTARTGVGMVAIAVNASTALGTLTCALTAGTRAGAGRIVITSKIPLTLATQTGDQSTVGVVLSG